MMMKTFNTKLAGTMIRMILVAFVFSMFAANAFSQINPFYQLSESRYGFSVTEMTTKTGQGKAYIPYFTAEKGRRILEIGVILQDSEQILTGFTAAFKVMLGKNGDLGVFNSCSSRLNPYLFYNFNYFSKNYSTSDNPALFELAEEYGPRIRIGSHEHYLGLGMKLNISNKICVDFGYGFGTYIGSIENLKNADDLESFSNRSGFSSMYKLSVGFNIF